MAVHERCPHKAWPRGAVAPTHGPNVPVLIFKPSSSRILLLDHTKEFGGRGWGGGGGGGIRAKCFEQVI